MIRKTIGFRGLAYFQTQPHVCGSTFLMYSMFDSQKNPNSLDGWFLRDMFEGSFQTRSMDNSTKVSWIHLHVWNNILIMLVLPCCRRPSCRPSLMCKRCALVRWCHEMVSCHANHGLEKYMALLISYQWIYTLVNKHRPWKSPILNGN